MFCQKEDTNLIGCGNKICKGAYCDNCLLKYLSKQSTHKCPSCSLDIDKNVVSCLRDNRSSSSSSSSPTRTHYNNNYYNSYNNSNNLSNRLQYNSYNSQQRQQRPLANNTNNYNNNNHNNVGTMNNFSNKHPAVDGKLYVREVNEPCDGYENYKSILITFEFEDGIQNVSFYLI